MKYYILFSLLLLSTLLRAEDVEIYQGAQIKSRPNVMLVMDTSRSMSIVEKVEDRFYDPDITYEVPLNGFDPEGIYLALLSSGEIYLDTEISEIRRKRIHPDSLICSQAKESLDTTGVYSGGVYFWTEGWWPVGTWVSASPVNAKQNNAIICQNQPEYIYQGNKYKYLSTSGSHPFTNSSGWFSNRFYGIPTRYYRNVFKGNYLNFKIAQDNNNGDVKFSRIAIARRAAKDALASVGHANIGLMRFDSYSNGGFVDIPISPIEDMRPTFTNKVNSYFTWGGTPLEETYHEAFLYLTGKSPRYGNNSYSGRPDGFINRLYPPFVSANQEGIIDPILSQVELDKTPSVSSSKTSGGTYRQPTVTECTKSSIILFTDGIPMSDSASNSAIRSIVSQSNLPATMDRSCTGDGQCMDELAYHMANQDMYPDIDGKQTISTHIVGGFFARNPTEKAQADALLGAIAEAGNGKYYTADTYEEIKEAIEQAIGDETSKSATFTAPSVAVNSFNRLESSDQIYFSLFQPSSTNDWRGNLKRYRLGGNSGILDADNQAAVDNDTGKFKDSARSIWTPENYPDGNDVKLGGVANKLTHERSVFTNLSGNTLTKVNDTLSKDLLYPLKDDPSYLSELRNWIAGKTESGEPRLEIEDPLHSQPVIINYSSNLSVAFIGTNSGYLHGFDINQTTPKELFAFIPRELLHNPDQYMSPRHASAPKVYGMDGPISYWHKDLNLNGIVDGADKVYLYVAMRRGGHSYYALDITNPAAPQLVWKIHGFYPSGTKNAPAVTPGFENLGQTWSKLTPAEVIWKGQRKVVLFAGAGYDTREDGTTLSGPTDRLSHQIGTTIYMIDAQSGQLLWDAERHADLEIGNTMTSAFTADLTLIDRDADGFVDMFYAADLSGRLWRFDMLPGHTTESDFVKGGILADVYSGSGAGNRRFYNAPDISYFNKAGDDFILISIGSGYRSHPLSRSTQDYLFLIKDHDALVTPEEYSTAGFSDFPTWGNNPSSRIGWKYQLPRSSEKILNPTITYNGTVFFTAYQPSDVYSPGDTGIAACDPQVGTSKLYSININSALDHDDEVAPPEIEPLEVPGIPPVTIPPNNVPLDPDNDGGSGPPGGKGADCKKSGTVTMVGLVSIENQKTPRCDVVVREYWKEVANAQN